MMKRSVHTLFILTLASLSFNAVAQTYPSKDSPNPLQIEAVRSELVTFKDACGFGSVYIRTLDLKELLTVKNCVGVRFYVAMEDPNQRFADVIAVAINSDGKEIGDFLERKYHLAKALDAHYPNEFKKLNVSAAKKAVMNLKNGVAGYAPYATFLSIQSLNQILNTSGANGLRIYASGYNSESENLRTMCFGSVAYNNKEINDLTSTYLQSRLPCPVDCGADTYLLWNR